MCRKVDDDCLQELRWVYERRNLAEVRRDIAQWLAKWQAKYSRLCNWVEEHIEETLTYYRLPLPHHKHLKSTNMLERLNQELKRRTHVVRAHSGDCDRPFRPKVITDSGDHDHAVMRPEGPARRRRRSWSPTRVQVAQQR